MAINLSELKKSTQKPPRILIHGGEGVGKTTFACNAPNVYMLDLEKGRAQCNPLMAQEPTTYNQVLEHISALIEQDHDYHTLVIDSLDVLETMISDHVCKAGGYKSISTPGFGKGYGERTMVWAEFWKALDYLRDTKNMMIIMIAHSQIVKVEDPILPSFDCHELHLYRTDKAKAVEIPDIVGYCMIKTYTTKDGERNMATTAGERVIKLTKNPAYTAKNRYSLPDELPLNWDTFYAALKNTNKQEMN